MEMSKATPNDDDDSRTVRERDRDGGKKVMGEIATSYELNDFFPHQKSCEGPKQIQIGCTVPAVIQIVSCHWRV